MIQISDTELGLYNSQFVNNGVLLSHSQIADDNCSLLSVTVDGCVFNNDIDSRPVYRPGVNLAGCETVQLSVTDSQFQTAPILVNADLHRCVLSLADPRMGRPGGPSPH